MSALDEMKKHRERHSLAIQKECNGFLVDDHVKYTEEGEERSGYIYCFRRFGYNWFAWIYVSQNDFTLNDCIYVGNLCKIEDE